jgi:TolA-binding protein
MIVALILTFAVAVLALARTVIAEIHLDQVREQLREATIYGDDTLQRRIDALAREIDSLSLQLAKERDARRKQADQLETDFDNHRARMAVAFREGA